MIPSTKETMPVKLAITFLTATMALAGTAEAHLGPVQAETNASAYCPGSSGTRMADGHHVYLGAIASAYLPMHTLIRTTRRIHGRHWFRVRDRGGPAMRMDFWLPSCGEAIRFGRRTVRYRVAVHPR